MVDISVVIPTCNRAAILSRTLEALKHQNFEAGAWEVLVIDDGSTDETASVVRSCRQDFPVPLYYLFQQNRKQGAARNLGARRARGELLLFLGDDIVPTAGFLAEHARSRDKLPSRIDRSKVAVIGYSRWPPEFETTPFLEFIGEQGWQFGFSLIETPEDVPFNFFYTSNLSLPRCFFLENGGFDEGFQEYGWEDVELSWRLKKQDMRIVYNSRAVAYHYHPTSLESFVKRQRKVGESAWHFYQLHPELSDFLSVHRTPRYSRSTHLKMKTLTWLCRVAERRAWPDLSRYYPDLLSYYYNLGLIQARESSYHWPEHLI